MKPVTLANHREGEGMNERAGADRSVGMKVEKKLPFYCKIEPFCPLWVMSGSKRIQNAAEPVFLFLFAY